MYDLNRMKNVILNTEWRGENIVLQRNIYTFL